MSLRCLPSGLQDGPLASEGLRDRAAFLVVAQMYEIEGFFDAPKTIESDSAQQNSLWSCSPETGHSETIEHDCNLSEFMVQKGTAGGRFGRFEAPAFFEIWVVCIHQKASLGAVTVNLHR